MLVACLLAAPVFNPKGGLWGFLMMQSLLVSLMVVFGMPAESVHDLVGSPTLGWPDSMEVVCRSAAFFGGAFAMLDGAALLAVGGTRRFSRLNILASMAFAMMIWQLVVVHWANTDNITELLPNSGLSVRMLALWLWLFLFGLGISLPTAAVGGNKIRLLFFAILMVLTTVPLGWVLLKVGTEGSIVKYGKSFSALQFLFSADRQSLLSGTHLFLRYGVTHACVMVIGLLCQIFMRRVYQGMARKKY